MKISWVIVLVFFIFLVGCAGTRTMVRTDPDGAMVFVGEKPVGTTPMAADLNEYLGFGQALGLGVSELLLRFRLEGYEDEIVTVNKHGGSLFSTPQWPGEVFTRLKEKKKQQR